MQFKGVVINARLPVESSLGIELDLTGLFSETGEDYISFKQGLEDRLNRLDEKYAKHVNKLRGRRLTAQYKTYIVGEGKQKKKVRGRFLFVIPYPSKYHTIISDIRTRFYDKTRGVLTRHNCIPLSSITVGKHRFVTYFLHEHDAADLMKDIDENLNPIVSDLNRQIAEFEHSSDFADILQYIESKVDNSRWSRYPVTSLIHPVQLSFTPLVIGREIIEMYTDATLRKELDIRMKEVATKIIEEFHSKMLDWIEIFTERLDKMNSNDVRMLETKYKNINDVVDRYGIRQALSKELAIIQSLLESSKTGNIDETVNQIAGYLGAPKGADAASTLREIRMKVANVSSETRAFIDTIV